MDVKNAFLQGELEEQVYMVQHPRFQSVLSMSVVCRLKKSLYGLKEAPCAWNTKITHRLRRMGFSTSKSDSSIFIRQGQHGPVSILLYVDDLVIVDIDPRMDTDQPTTLCEGLAASFNMKDLVNLHYFLRIEVIRTLKGILINQQFYVLSMLFKFGMTDCKTVTTPLDRNVKLRPKSVTTCDPTRFRQIVGSLIYLIITRSDLSYAVGLISRFMS